MSTGTTQIDGIISGLDTQSIINQLANIRRRPIQLMQTHKGELESKLQTYQSLNASLQALGVLASELADAETFIPRTTTVADEGVLAASATTDAEIGSYDITVNDLAQAHKVQSGSIASLNDALGYSGDIRVNGTTVTLEAADSLADLRDAINNADTGVAATVLQVSDSDYRLTLQADQAGAENQIQLVEANAIDILENLGLLSTLESIRYPIADGAESSLIDNPDQPAGTELGYNPPAAGTVQIDGQSMAIDLAADSLYDIRDRINAEITGVTAAVVSEDTDDGTAYRLQIVGDSGTPTFTDDNNNLKTLGILQKDIANELQVAQDASVTIDGVDITRSTNSLDDVIEGVSMELLAGSTGQSTTLTVGPNTGSVVESIQSAVDTYNSIVDTLNQAQSFDSETNTGGILFGESSILRLEQGMHAAMTAAVTNPNGNSLVPSQAGISTLASGKLSVNTVELQNALNEDPQLVSRIFGLHVQPSNANIEYVSSTAATADSGAEGYDVNITQVATRATATSATLASGITTNETLTFDGNYNITLSAGMTLNEAADHLNVWFDEYGLDYQASVSGDQLQIQHEAYGSRYSIGIASSLDDGSGGTDLGGTSAGDTATYAGTDVAGTINGEDATGTGQRLRGNAGNENTEGLSLLIKATETGDVGNVVVAKGAIKRLNDYISSITDTEGMMARSVESVENDIEAVEDDIEQAEERVQRYVDDMWDKFVSLEVKMGQASLLEQYISGYTLNMNANSSYFGASSTSSGGTTF